MAIAVALADKLDMLVGFWAIDEKPTGSKDPYALRRAALGVIRIVLENQLRIPLNPVLFRSLDAHVIGGVLTERDESLVLSDLLAFFADRLKVHLRDQGARHDLIDAVFSLSDQDDLLLIVASRRGAREISRNGRRRHPPCRHQARRQHSAHRGEEGRQGLRSAPRSPSSSNCPRKRPWPNASIEVERAAATAIENEDFEAAMAAMALLRAPVDAFFDHVTVNADDADLRANRLRLLNRIRATTLTVADFSKIEG